MHFLMLCCFKVTHLVGLTLPQSSYKHCKIIKFEIWPFGGANSEFIVLYSLNNNLQILWYFCNALLFCILQP
ncbi:hypothetical protein DFH28DRAFT_958485 [Melampsora americana]|nr:hypothetical protein DFH28DRAFT_958485 [Melampsora americana]